MKGGSANAYFCLQWGGRGRKRSKICLRNTWALPLVHLHCDNTCSVLHTTACISECHFRREAESDLPNSHESLATVNVVLSIFSLSLGYKCHGACVVVYRMSRRIAIVTAVEERWIADARSLRWRFHWWRPRSRCRVTSLGGPRLMLYVCRRVGANAERRPDARAARIGALEPTLCDLQPGGAIVASLEGRGRVESAQLTSSLCLPVTLNCLETFLNVYNFEKARF
jgi:hypothetical protein